MDQLIDNYPKLQTVIIDSLESLKEGLYLIVLHADKIPPHIGLSYKSEFYSLKVHSIDFKLPINHLNQVIQRRKVAALCYEIAMEPFLIDQRIEEVFLTYRNGLREGLTCLAPLNDLFGTHQKCEVVMELLNYLMSQSVLKKVYGLNLPEDYQGIPSYTIEQVYLRISQLKQ